MVFSIFILSSHLSTSQEIGRSSIEEKYKWNLKDLYASDDAWQKKKKELEEEVPSIEKFKGTVGQSSQRILACLELLYKLKKELWRLGSYATMSSDEDTRVSKYTAMKAELQQLATKFRTFSAFIEPEILKLDPVKIKLFLKENKGLDIHRKYLWDILRRKQHTGAEGEEKIIADASLITGNS